MISNPSISKLHGWLLILLTAWLVASVAYHGLENGVGEDFSGFYHAAQRLNLNQPLYIAERMPYCFPPTLALCLKPLATLSFRDAFKCWGLLNIAFLFAGVAIYATAVFSRRFEPVATCLILITCFRFWPTSCELGLFGNCNCLLFIFVCALFASFGARRFLASALVIASGAAIKTWMIGLAATLVWQRRWKDLLYCLAAFGGALACLFSAVGWQEWSMFRQTTSTFLNRHNLLFNYQPAQSIMGFARVHFLENGNAHALANSPLLEATFVIVGFAALAAGAFYVLTHPAKDAFESRLHLGFFVTSLLLALPVCDPQYLILALPALWSVLVPPSEDAHRLPKAAWIAAVFIYIAGTRIQYSSLPQFHDLSGWKSLLISDGFFWLASLWGVLLACIIFVNRKERTTVKPALAGVADAPIAAPIS